MADEQPQSGMPEFKVDKNNLYREENFTDMRVASIRRLTPVKPDGTPDKTRKAFFIGHTNLLSPEGPIPIQNEIKAKDLQQAIKRFPEAMVEATQRLMEEVRKMQAEKESPIVQEEPRIIVPGR